MITIYCDGGCRNHGNVRGGHVHEYDKSAYAFKITQDGTTVKNGVGTQGYYGMTNNQMEIMAVINGLIRGVRLPNVDIEHNDVTVVSDSKYVDNAINQGWLKSWVNNKSLLKRKNAGLWSILLTIMKYYPHLTFRWTKGHAAGKSKDSQGNIFVDHLLNKTMDKMPSKQEAHD